MAENPDRAMRPPFTYRGQNAELYERLMGRWSRRLAPLLIRFGGLADGERVLDVGCGTGSLTFALPEIANIARGVGVDLSSGYIEAARARNTDPRLTFQEADARELPFEDDSFDRAFSMLVLHFIPDAPRAVAEMRRVVRPGGTVAAAVWDTFGGQPQMRMILDMAVARDRSFIAPLFRSLDAPDEMATVWRELGLIDVKQTSLLIRMEFSSFEDYWLPVACGEGGLVPQYVASLSDADRARVREDARRGYLGNRPDGSRSFACVAWACRGTVPE